MCVGGETAPRRRSLLCRCILSCVLHPLLHPTHTHTPPGPPFGADRNRPLPTLRPKSQKRRRPHTASREAPPLFLPSPFLTRSRASGHERPNALRVRPRQVRGLPSLAPPCSPRRPAAGAVRVRCAHLSCSTALTLVCLSYVLCAWCVCVCACVLVAPLPLAPAPSWPLLSASSLAFPRRPCLPADTIGRRRCR